MKRLLLLTPAILVLASCATQQARLTIGDPAPALVVSDWVKGAPVQVKLAGDVQQSDQDVVVLEFWATWCGPCIASIPHVTELQQTYKDKGVRIVGVTTHDENNTLEMVQDFVKEQGDAMDYGVAFDQDGKTYKAYMKAAVQNGIPTTFILDRTGRVAGEHPPPRPDKRKGVRLGVQTQAFWSESPHRLGSEAKIPWNDDLGGGKRDIPDQSFLLTILCCVIDREGSDCAPT